MATIVLRKVGYRCERCGKEWEARGPRLENRPRVAPDEPVKPRICPQCKSPYWETPRRPAKSGK